MTKEEFINKWCGYDRNRDGMEFDLISVIDNANTERNNEIIAEIEERYMEEEIPQKAYTTTVEDAKKYIKRISFGGISGA